MMGAKPPLISFYKNDLSFESQLFDNSNYNISTGVASSITSYSRIFMNEFKDNKEFTIYYTDTDNII